MTSVLTSTRQATGSYFVNLADISGYVYSELSVKAAIADSTIVTAPTPAAWDNGVITSGNAGTIFLKDMGKSLTGYGLVFRKIQLVGVDPSTSGVSGTATAADPFLTGYILLAINGASGAFGGDYVAPVAKYGI